MSRGSMFLGGALVAVVVAVAVLSFLTGSEDAPPRPQQQGHAVAADTRTSTRSILDRMPQGGGSFPRKTMQKPFTMQQPALHNMPRPGASPQSSPSDAPPLSLPPSAQLPPGAFEGAREGARPRRFGVDKDGIQAAVRAAMPEIRECYEEWLKADPKLSGAISVGFRIANDPKDPEGAKVDQVEVQRNSIKQVALEGCILNVFSGLSFDRPENGEVKVTYPLNFSSQ